MKLNIITIFFLAISGLGAAHADSAPNERCLSTVTKTALAFAEKRGLAQCHVLGAPDFDHSRGAGAGLVSVDLDCSKGSQAQVNMLWVEDGDSCGVSHVSFWNP